MPVNRGPLTQRLHKIGAAARSRQVYDYRVTPVPQQKKGMVKLNE